MPPTTSISLFERPLSGGAYIKKDTLNYFQIQTVSLEQFRRFLDGGDIVLCSSSDADLGLSCGISGFPVYRAVDAANAGAINFLRTFRKHNERQWHQHATRLKPNEQVTLENLEYIQEALTSFHETTYLSNTVRSPNVCTAKLVFILAKITIDATRYAEEITMHDLAHRLSDSKSTATNNPDDRDHDVMMEDLSSMYEAWRPAAMRECVAKEAAAYVAKMDNIGNRVVQRKLRDWDCESPCAGENVEFETNSIKTQESRELSAVKRDLRDCKREVEALLLSTKKMTDGIEQTLNPDARKIMEDARYFGKDLEEHWDDADVF